jgi:hypothetical protein
MTSFLEVPGGPQSISHTRMASELAMCRPWPTLNTRCPGRFRVGNQSVNRNLAVDRAAGRFSFCSHVCPHPRRSLEARVEHPRALRSLTLDFSHKNFLIKLRWAVAGEGANPFAGCGTKGWGFILQALTQTFVRAALTACARALGRASALTSPGASSGATAEDLTDDDVREDDCALCAQWPATLRPVLRTAIDNVPLAKPVCDPCQEAFWVNVVRRQDRLSG